MEVFPDGVSASVKKGPNLYEFLVEAELQHYFNSFKNTLKITHPSQLKFTTESDLIDIRMSKPEMRRLKKYYEKHFPNNYLSKLKKILSSRKHEQNVSGASLLINNDTLTAPRTSKVASKHIIPAASITVNKELGMGEFGVVQQGVWCNEGERIQVAIKCLSRDRMQSNMVEFLKEASIMHNIDHPNIVRFFGVVLPNVEGSLMLVTELAPLRSLLECLKEPSLRSSFPVLTLCDFAYQICDGMQYLEENRLIHRDLAARNILVFSKNKVKISDFGLSRALGQGKDYYQTNFNVNLKLPIAWCAPECISYLRFTTASDVWAFGVTLWEMFSYGFQPWAALTGQQILEAIDEPNFQRLEQPDCCPVEHYNLMLNCWRHEPTARPTFSEISSTLVDSRPEQVKAKITSNEGPHMLSFRLGDIITVLDKKTHGQFWKGTTLNGKTGLFDPVNVVTFLSSDLPSSNFLRSGIDSTRSSARRKLKSEMISAPQGDFKHAGHIGYDGAFFGDLSFLGGSKGNYGSVPTQVVAPYRPHKDSEEAPLLEGCCVSPPPTPNESLQDHEYHEISDEEANQSPGLDLGPSLMAEMEMMFSNLGTQNNLDHEGSNRTNELKEKLSSKPKKQATVKPISANEKKTIDTAIAMANEITIRSLTATTPTTTPVATNKKKSSFTFKFPTVHDPNNVEKQLIDNRRNFSDEALSMTDLQSKITQEEQMAYEGLVDIPAPEVCQLMVTNPLRMLRSGQPIINNRNRSTSMTCSNTLPSKLNGLLRKSDSLNEKASTGSPVRNNIVTLPRTTTTTTVHVKGSDMSKEENNPIPLPPRDKNKLLLTAKPRHTRKHPLIIPASSVQRTLDKVNTVSPLSIRSTSDPFTPTATTTTTVINPNIEPVYSNDVIAQNADRNLESLHFEEEIESNLNALDDIHSDHDVVDCGGGGGGEGGAYFKNDEEDKMQSHHVSCEDLIKFSNWKPNSRTRGHDSDEVRIMLKVLGKDMPSQKCLEALDQFDWDVMKAIKVLKVYKAVKTDLKSCQNALENTMWDVNRAAQWILHMDGEVAQV